MQYVADLQEMFTALLPLVLIAGGIVIAMLILLSVLAVAHNALNDQ